MMKRTAIAAVITLLFLLVGPAAGQEPCSRQRLITVTGTAEIRVVPDEATLTFGVDSHDRDLAAAKAQNDGLVRKVLAAARAAGVDEKDIQTSTLTLSANYSEEKVPRLLGYEVEQTITLKLKNLSKYESLMTELLQAGVNRLEGVQFAVAEPRKYNDEARAGALRAAREKAVAMAAELSQTIGKPVQIAEESENPYELRTQNFASSRTREPLGGVETTVASGQIAIRAIVRVTFQLE